MLDLLETLGIALQQLRGLLQFLHAGFVPLAALQALPDFQNLTGLVDHPLGEVLFEPVAAGVFLLDHGLSVCVWRRGLRVMAPCYHQGVILPFL